MPSRRLLIALSVGLLTVWAGASASRGEVAATPDAFITFNSELTPRVLPRTGTAPVAIRIEGHVKRRKGRAPVPLARIQLAIHHAAKIDRRGLPVCELSDIDPASSALALAACGDAKVGYGVIEAESKFPGQPHFKFHGRAILFNGRLPDGRSAILIHVFNAQPPSSFVFPFVISKHRGLYGTVLTANVRLSRWTRVTDFRLVLKRNFVYRGQRRSYLNASCPAPAGLTLGIAPFVRATLAFGNGRKSQISVVSSCKVAS